MNLTPGFKSIPESPTHVAPDLLEVRELEDVAAGEVCEFRLNAGITGNAVANKTVSEFWFLTAGAPQVWLDGTNEGLPSELAASDYFVVPAGTAFQLSNAKSDVDARFLAITMPKYPGPQDTEHVDGYWET